VQTKFSFVCILGATAVGFLSLFFFFLIHGFLLGLQIKQCNCFSLRAPQKFIISTYDIIAMYFLIDSDVKDFFKLTGPAGGGWEHRHYGT